MHANMCETAESQHRRPLCIPTHHDTEASAGRALRLVLQKMTACVMVSVSYRSHNVSNFHSSRSTATKNCLMPCAQHKELVGVCC